MGGSSLDQIQAASRLALEGWTLIAIFFFSVLSHLAHSSIHGITDKVGQLAKNVEGPAEDDRWVLSMSLGTVPQRMMIVSSNSASSVLVDYLANAPLPCSAPHGMVRRLVHDPISQQRLVLFWVSHVAGFLLFRPAR